jgi:hypothetical protein
MTFRSVNEKFHIESNHDRNTLSSLGWKEGKRMLFILLGGNPLCFLDSKCGFTNKNKSLRGK